MNNNDTLNKLREWTTHASTLTQAARRASQKHFAYYDGEQLSQQVKKELKERGQPEQYLNVLKMIANKVKGYKIDTRTVVKVSGRQEDDEDKGRIYTNLLRSFTDSLSETGISYYDEKNLCDVDLMVGGLCAMEPRVRLLGERDERGRELKEIEFLRLDPNELLTDPFSKALDFRDSRFMTRFFATPIEEVYAKYGTESISACKTGDALAELEDITYTDASSLRGWGSYSDMAFLRYTWFWEYAPDYKSRKMRYAVWYDSKIIDISDSPYDILSFPTIVRRLFRGRGQKHWYGLFSDLLPIQDQINYCALRLSSMLASTKLIMEEDAVDDIWNFKNEWRKDNAVAVVNKGAISEARIKEVTQDNRIAQMRELIADHISNAKVIAGFNDEALGVAVNRLSGDAIEQRQRTGLMGLLHFIDASGAFDKQVFMTAISHIRTFFDAKQAFYVTELGARAAKRIEVDTNVLNIGRFDVTVDFVPIQSGSKTERYRLNMEVLKIVQQIMPPLVERLLPLFLRDSDAPLAEAVIAEIAAAKEEIATAGQDEAAQAQVKRLELELAKLQSEIEKNQAKAAKDAMDAAATQGAMGAQANGEIEGAA